MKKKGFTLVELLVVIAIIALLMGILMPALARVRQIAYRMVCGTNLSGIGKGMLMYSNDHDEEYPIAGLRNSIWSKGGYIPDFDARTRLLAFQEATGRGGATITSSMYLLIRYADLQPKHFNCKGDVGTKVFKVSDEVDDSQLDVTEVWDFGSGNQALDPGFYNSYSYHLPYFFPDPREGDGQEGTPVNFPVTPVSRAGSPVCADRNPYLDKNAESYIDGGLPGEDPPEWIDRNTEVSPAIPAHYEDMDNTGNAAPHQREGQNVLFNDGHVLFEHTPNCGIENDNIWKSWEMNRPDQVDKQLGRVPYDTPEVQNGDGNPYEREDAYLVTEHNKGLE